MKITPELMVKDVVASLHFYREVLGFSQSVLFPEEKPIFAKIGFEEASLMLYEETSFREEMPHLSSQIGGTTALFFEIPSIENWYQKIENKAVIVAPLHDTPYGAKEFAIFDPDGYTIIFSETNE